MTFYQLRAINTDGSSPAGGGLLPDFEKLSLGIMFSDVGSLTFDYAIGGINDALVTEQREIAVYDHLGEVPDCRFVIESSNGERWSKDGVLYRSWTGRSWWKTFDDALIYGVNWPTIKTEAKRSFVAVTPGALLKTVIDKAQTLGEMTGLTYTFTNTLDSAGIAWAGTVTMDVDTLGTILNLITSMVENGLIEVRMVGRELRVYNPNGLGTDRTVGATPLTLWSGLTEELPEQRDSRGLKTVAIVQGDNGACVEVVNSAAVTTWGRRPLVISQSGIVDTGTLTAIGTAALTQTAQVRSERSAKYPIVIGTTAIPFRDYNCGDWVYNDMSGTPERVRVRQLTVEQESDERSPTVVATLNDLFLEAEIALARQISGITGGARLDSSAPGTDPVTLDTLAPSIVAGLGGTSTAYVDSQARTWTFLTLTWAAVTTNTDTSAITDLDHYEVFVKKASDSIYSHVLSTLNTSAIVDLLLPNVAYNVQVRAVDKFNNAGAFSSTLVITTANDTTAPPVPKTPVVVDYLGQVRIFWDGTGSASEAMPGDFKWTEVHLSTTSGFTPSAATLIDTLSGAGYSIMTDLVYDTAVFVKLISVDRVGNKSAASTQASATPVRVSGLDVAALAIATGNLGDGAVTALKIADATITSAKIGTAQILNANIANAAIDDAKISSVSAGKITVGTLIADVTVSARIKTANTGARVELSSSGLLAFNTAGAQTVNIAASTGDVTITGSIKTGIAGGGSAYITMDDSVDRSTIKFWEQTGTRFSYINSPIGSGGQVQLGLNTGNFDLVTGNLAGGTQGFARLYMNQISTQLARVDAAQAAFGGELLLTHTSASLRRSSSGGVNTGGQIFIDDGSVQIARNTAGSPATGYGRFYINSGGYNIEKAGGGPQHRGDSIANVAWADAAGSMISGIWIDSAGTKTFGPFNSDAGFSFADGTGWANTSFSLNAWGPFVVMTMVTTRTGAAVAAGTGIGLTVGTITAAGSLTPVTTVVHFQNTSNNGAGNMTSGGVIQLNALDAALASGAAIRAQAVWWRG